MMNRNDFPQMTEQFDHSVRRALDSLPERERRPVHRFSIRRAVCASAEPPLRQTRRAGSRCCFRMAATRISRVMYRRQTTQS